MKLFVCKLACTSLICVGCGLSNGNIDPKKITSLNIIDRNGLSETISSAERLKPFENRDFLSPQPYQKVLRVYGKEKNGNVRSCITSYHPNGQPKQYLEAINNRACGVYREWHSNGQLKIEGMVIGGVADLNTKAEQSWLFDGMNTAWNDDGTIVARIPYSKGEINGKALYYHHNGKIWKTLPYENDQLEGFLEVFLEDGSLFQSSEFHKNKRHGLSERFWSNGMVVYKETYENGLLKSGDYFDSCGNKVSEVCGGFGERAVFGKDYLQELQLFKNGTQDGLVRVFDERGGLIQTYSVKDGLRDGEEIDFFQNSSQKKLVLNWQAGILNGCVKTWYPDGTLESQKEISMNKKNGLLTAWYPSGALMLVEEYDQDRLVKGEYYREGEKVAISKVENGKGFATLFSSAGNLIQKVYYQDGKPTEEFP